MTTKGQGYCPFHGIPSENGKQPASGPTAHTAQGRLGPIPPAYPTPTGECCPALAANRFYLSMDAYPHAWGRHAWLIRCYIP